MKLWMLKHITRKSASCLVIGIQYCAWKQFFIVNGMDESAKMDPVSEIYGHLKESVVRSPYGNSFKTTMKSRGNLRWCVGMC